VQPASAARGAARVEAPATAQSAAQGPRVVVRASESKLGRRLAPRLRAESAPLE